jgi:hypothetical protein
MSRTVPTQIAAVLIAGETTGAAVRDPALSTATGGDPIPGAAVNDDNSAMEIAAGGYAWAPETLALSTLRGGDCTPGPTAARVTWLGQAGGSGTEARGWLPATVACGWHKLSSAATGSTATGCQQPHGIKLRDGKVLIAFTATISAKATIRVGVYDPEVGGYAPPVGRYDSGSAAYVWPTAAAWTWVDAIDEDDLNGVPPLTPCLLELPDGTILLFFSSLQSYRGGAQFYAVGSLRSQDGGLTWTLNSADTGARYAQATGVPYLINAVSHGGYLTLILAHDAGGGSSAFLHWYSADLGSAWTVVESDPTGSVEWSPQIVACDDGSVLAFWLKASGGAALLTMARKTTPAGSFDTTTTIEQWLAQTFAPGEDRLAVCVADDHTILIAAVVYASGGYSERLRVLRAPQDIASGDDLIQIPAPGESIEAEALDYADGSAGSQHAYARALVPWGEGWWVLWELPGGSPDAVAQQIARYSSIDWNGPTFGLYQLSATVERWGVWWDASYLPSLITAWTVGGAGAEGSSAERALSLDYSGGAAFRYYERTGTAGSGVVAMVRCRVDSGGNLSADDIGVRVRSANGTFDYDVSVRLTTTAIRAYDNNAAGTIGTDATGLTASQTIDLLISLTGTGRFVCWYKEASSQVWLQGPTGNATNDGATPAATPLIRWGALTSSTGKSTWFFVGSSLDAWPSWPATVTEPNQPQIEFGREVSIWPQYLSDGRTFAATSAPALTGEGWTLPPAWRYPVDALDPAVSPSPSVLWRSDADADQQIIAWDFADEVVQASPLMGLYLRAPNFLTAVLQYWNDTTGSWTDLATLSTVAVSGSFARTGRYVAAGAAATGLPVGRDEWAGSWVVLSSGGSNHYRRIASNTPGYWSNAADALRAVITLDADSDLTGLPTTGGIQILAPECAVVANLGETPSSRLRVRIPARTYASADQDYHQAAVMVVGPVIALGQPPAWGGTRGLTPVQDLTEAANGRRRVRTLAPRGRRDMTIAWTDPVLDLVSTDGTREVIAPAASGWSAAFAHDPRAAEDLLIASDGARRLCVFLPSVTMPGATLTSRDALIYGRWLGATRRTEVIYRPDEHTLATISEITISEEL